MGCRVVLYKTARLHRSQNKCWCYYSKPKLRICNTWSKSNPVFISGADG